jgi:outer membrane protein assembly factor BamB
VFEIDLNSVTFEGDLVSQGVTNNEAVFANQEQIQSASSWYLVKISTTTETQDLNTGTEPTITSMRSLISEEQCSNNELINITPLTTLTTDLALRSATSLDDISTTLVTSSSITKESFGYGLLTEVNLFSAPTILTNNADSISTIIEHRTAIEASAAALSLLSVRYEIAVSEAIELVISDMEDGQLDGDIPSGSFSYPQGAFDYLSSLPIEYAPLLGTDIDGNSETVDPFLVADIAYLLDSEQNIFGTTIDMKSILNGLEASNIPKKWYAKNKPGIEGWVSARGGKNKTGFMPINSYASEFSIRWAKDYSTFLGEVVSDKSGIFLVDHNYPNNPPVNSALLSINPANGEILWDKENSTAVEPLILEDFVVTTEDFYKITIVDKITGETVVVVNDAVSNFMGVTTIIASNEKIIVGDGLEVAAIDLKGDALWRKSPDVETILANNSFIYLFGRTLRMWEPENGVEVNYKPLEASGIAALLTDTNHLIYSAHDNVQNIRFTNSIDATTLETRWINESTYYRIVYGLGKLYGGERGKLSVWDEQTGDLLWEWEFDDASERANAMALTLDHIFIATDKNVYAVSLISHAAEWKKEGAGKELSLSNQGALFISNDFNGLGGEVIMVDLQAN